MDNDYCRSPLCSWFQFFGVLFLLIGLYGVLRILHVQVRHVPYPIRGVIPNTFITSSENTTSYTRESECEPYPQIYYDYGPDGKQVPRDASPEEIAVAQEQAKRCVRGFDEDRSKQAQYDKNEAAFFIFLGLGLLASKRFFL